MAFGSRPAGRGARSGSGAGLSLKGRALRLLAQRDHSRVELSRKLGPHVESAAQLEALLDDLERGGFLSAQRFAESLAFRRSARFGLRRIEQELGSHRLDETVSAPVLRALHDSERARALAAWRKRFGQPGGDAGERARQWRFLAQRGFTSESIGWVMRHGVFEPEGLDDTADEPPPSAPARSDTARAAGADDPPERDVVRPPRSPAD
jgi:regulatory protein